MADERSRKSVWENFVFNFLQKIPAEEMRERFMSACDMADAMLAEHDKRWKKPETLTLPKGQVK